MLSLKSFDVIFQTLWYLAIKFFTTASQNHMQIYPLIQIFGKSNHELPLVDQFVFLKTAHIY